MATFAENIAATVVAIRNKLNGLTNTVNMKVSSVGGAAPITSSGGTAPVISISAATTSAAGSMSATDKAKLDGMIRAMIFGTPGVLSASDTVTLYPVAYAGSLTTTNSVAKCLVAPTNPASFPLKRNGTVIGGVVFNPGSTTGVWSINTATVAYGDTLILEAPSTADATLAGVHGLIRIV